MTCPRRAGVWLLLLVSTGCSQLVDPDSLALRCERPPPGDPDPCGELGMRCGSANVCEVCSSENERCNGFDDDCDGMVDEGQDRDGDGFTWCGGGDESLRDCVDDDPDVSPPRIGADGEVEKREVCDGKDNDCNGVIDDAPECDRVDCRTEPCSGGLECQAETGVCVAPRPTGSSCESDVECEGGFCVAASVLGLGESFAAGERICATACCRDEDCGADTACIVAATGVRACIPTRIAGRTPAGVACDRSADCASGICRAETCVSTCASDDHCTDGELCVADLAGSLLSGGATVWTCGEPQGRGEGGEICTPFDPRSCASGLCFEGFVAVCAIPCGTSDDCMDGSACEFYDGGNSRYSVCAESASGQTTCCTDADCGEGQRCRPSGGDQTWSMYCQ